MCRANTSVLYYSSISFLWFIAVFTRKRFSKSWHVITVENAIFFLHEWNEVGEIPENLLTKNLLNLFCLSSLIHISNWTKIWEIMCEWISLQGKLSTHPNDQLDIVQTSVAFQNVLICLWTSLKNVFECAIWWVSIIVWFQLKSFSI